MSPALAGGFLTTAPPGKSLLFLYNYYFFIIRNLHSILFLGKQSLTFLQNDFKENFHINISFPFYYYGSIYSTLITLQVREPSFQDKKHVELLFGIPCTIFRDQKKKKKIILTYKGEKHKVGKAEVLGWEGVEKQMEGQGLSLFFLTHWYHIFSSS